MLKLNRKSGPTFIGVGPEKTGTTWIYSNLKAHPRVIVPPLKELRYFWEHANFPKEKVLYRLSNTESWHRNQYRDYFRRFLKRYSRNPLRLFRYSRRFVWDCRYLFSEHDDEWYLACFEQKEGFVCGEISPQYFFLPEAEINHIHDLLPDVKIIISLREPADWLWSFFRMMNRQLTRHSDQVLDTFLSDYKSAYSFSRALRSWKRHFSEDQLLVLFYDELRTSPWRFYSRICEFLTIEPDHACLSRLTKRVNDGIDLKPPGDFKERIEMDWRDDIEELSSMLPSLPTNWRSAYHGK